MKELGLKRKSREKTNKDIFFIRGKECTKPPQMWHFLSRFDSLREHCKHTSLLGDSVWVKIILFMTPNVGNCVIDETLGDMKKNPTRWAN